MTTPTPHDSTQEGDTMDTPLRARAEHAARYRKNLLIPAADLLDLIEARTTADTQITAVRTLHYRATYYAHGRPTRDAVCPACRDRAGQPLDWPCPTIDALDGAALGEGGDPR